jgi:NADH:ubiquinone oxidoreductase subunit F (NADH-binding)
MTLPRLLSGAGPETMSYQRHLSVHGELPARIGLDSALTAELTRAALRGRGGGAFPLAGKLDAVRRARGRPIVVVNGCEGEPLSVKDRLLLHSLPHLVIDGAVCCAAAIGSEEIVIAIDETSIAAGQALEGALRERPGLPGTTVAELPPGYVSGQETAVVNFINGGPAKPVHGPRVTTRGVDGQPTLIANPETLAHAALIARHGATWFRQLGTAEEPGSILVTLSGAVHRPGAYEIEYGSSLSSLLAAAGGVSEPVQAFLFGGYAGSWVDGGPAGSLRLSRDGLQRWNASLGAGVIVALAQSACPVAEVSRVAGWMARQSAGQCGPCVHGLASIAQALADVNTGVGGLEVFGDVRRWAAQVKGRGACAHPDGAARFVTSALDLFGADFEDHARYGLCDDCERPPVLVTPRLLTGVR